MNQLVDVRLQAAQWLAEAEQGPWYCEAAMQLRDVFYHPDSTPQEREEAEISLCELEERQSQLADGYYHALRTVTIAAGSSFNVLAETVELELPSSSDKPHFSDPRRILADYARAVVGVGLDPKSGVWQVRVDNTVVFEL